MPDIAIGGVNYASPVTVNGFSCRNCADVSLAAKNIDPAHPASGPNNRDAAQDVSRRDTDPVKVAAARLSAETASAQVVSYSAVGYQTAHVAPGQLVSFNA